MPCYQLFHYFLSYFMSMGVLPECVNFHHVQYIQGPEEGVRYLRPEINSHVETEPRSFIRVSGAVLAAEPCRKPCFTTGLSFLINIHVECERKKATVSGRAQRQTPSAPFTVSRLKKVTGVPCPLTENSKGRKGEITLFGSTC